MKTSLFDFTLPESLIAAEPANPRDASRMLVVNDTLTDGMIRDFPSYLTDKDIVVLNNTRVIPARLLGMRGEAKVEVLLHKRISLAHRGRAGVGASIVRQSKYAPLPTPPLRGEERWSAFAKPAKRLKPGDTIRFADDFTATVMEKRDDGQVLLAFDAHDFQEKLTRHGHMPLPPYIEKQRTVIARSASDVAIHLSSVQQKESKEDGSPRFARDDECYQTVYAAQEGSVAAPTAGLHFTPELLAALPCPRAHVTLHVGGGTFLPVKAEDTNDHVMHSEWAEISPEDAAAINAAKARGGRVVAVGTTSLRTLESAADAHGTVHPMSGDTNIFITPGYPFKCVDMLLTNFHLPRSTLFMLVSAFSGLERMQQAYAHAIAEEYRFYSYGDACLLEGIRD